MLIILILAAIIGTVIIADLILIAILWMMVEIRDAVANRRTMKHEIETQLVT